MSIAAFVATSGYENDAAEKTNRFDAVENTEVCEGHVESFASAMLS